MYFILFFHPGVIHHPTVFSLSCFPSYFFLFILLLFRLLFSVELLLSPFILILLLCFILLVLRPTSVLHPTPAGIHLFFTLLMFFLYFTLMFSRYSCFRCYFVPCLSVLFQLYALIFFLQCSQSMFSILIILITILYFLLLFSVLLISHFVIAYHVNVVPYANVTVLCVNVSVLPDIM